MGVDNGHRFSGHPCNANLGDDDRSAYRLHMEEVAGCFPSDTLHTLRLHFASMSEASSEENSMDIKTVLAALEAKGIQLTTQNVAPLVGQLVELGVAAAEKGISDLSKKAGVRDVTKPDAQ